MRMNGRRDLGRQGRRWVVLAMLGVAYAARGARQTRAFRKRAGGRM